MGTIVITGSSSGLGRAMTAYFAERGWSVAATMRTPEEHAELADRGDVHLYRLDVTDIESIERARDAILTDTGSVDVVVNNAGYALAGPFEAVSETQIRREFDTNVLGVMAVTRAFLPHFRDRRSGMFVNVSSAAGRITMPFLSLYVSSKFAVEGFSEAVAYELKEFGIRVKLVEPGRFETDVGGRSLDRVSRDELSAYEPAWNRFWEVWLAQEERPPRQVAETVFAAVTDGEDRLRYLVGEDAERAVRFRHKHGDDAYVARTAEVYLGSR
jgi:NAD(P)-dependent dehydrogenase (short-subunit alcohol dehydrogenase family)